MPELKSPTNSINVKTAIIGAGVSGISAATNLLNKNYEDFLVFEALDRVGGRCYTLDYGTSFIEYGAQYIHGQVDNPIYYIARDHKQIDEKYNKIYFDSENETQEDNNGICIEKDESESYMFTTQFGEILGLDKCYEVYHLVNKLVRQAKDFYLDKSNCEQFPTDQSVGEYLLEKLNEILNAKFETKLSENHNEAQVRQLIEGFLVWRCKSENIEIGCHSVTELSLKNYCIFKDMKGCQIIQTKYGYSGVIKGMIKSNEQEYNQRLRLNHSLEKILMCNELDKDLNKNSPCKHCLYTTDKNKIVLEIGNLNEESKKPLIVICDNVICTMSLGFLKENIENIIEPPSLIPEDKMKAISRLGYGTINKIFMVYDTPFWSKELKGIHNIWLKQDKNESLLNQLDGFNDSNWFESICYFEPVINQDNILCAWLSGCKFFEKFDHEKIKNDCTHVLKKMLNRDDIPLPKSLIMSNWGSNPYFFGSYSFLPLGSNSIDLENVAKPITINEKPVIMFAGEHTSETSFSTTHGAYLTGLRESKRILNSMI